MGKNIFYISNNSTKSIDVYLEKFQKLGFPAKYENIIVSASVFAHHLKYDLNYEGKVYVVGSKGIVSELGKVGIQSIGIDDHEVRNVNEKYIAEMPLDPEVKCVVVGLDFNFNYYKLAVAGSYLSQKDCLFIATNTDSTLPMGEGKSAPGTGSLLAAVEAVSGRKPDVIIGKPFTLMFEMLQKKHKINPDRTIMIGDRLNTDIEFAHNCGLRAGVMVLTGVATLAEVQQWQTSQDQQYRKRVPHFYLECLGDLGKLIQEENLSNR